MVVPTLGSRPQLLQHCLDSIASQGEPASIVIVAPEGNADVARLAAQYRATLVPDPGSLAAAINAGVRHARAGHEFVNWLGDDDLLEPGSLTATVRALDAAPPAVLAFGACRYIDEDGAELWISRAGPWAPRILKWGPDLIPQPGMLVRRSAWDAVGGLDETLRFAFDLDLLLKIQPLGGFIDVGRVVSSFRWHGDSLTVERPFHLPSRVRGRAPPRPPPSRPPAGLDLGGTGARRDSSSRERAPSSGGAEARGSGWMSLPAEFPSLEQYLLEALTEGERRSLGLLTFNQWPFALGAVSETALAAQAIGAHVSVGFWSGQTPLYDTGWMTSRIVARLLGSATMDQRAERALRAAGLPDDAFVSPPIRRWRPHALPELPTPLTRSHIRSLTYKGSDMGRSILQVHPDDNTPISEAHAWPRRWVAAAMRSYAWVYDQTEALIRDRDLGTIVVYNGRFTHDRAVGAAAQANGVRVLYYDTGGYDTDFDLTDATTHDWAHLQGRMLRMYDGWDPIERDAIGSAWFLNRQSHADVNARIFVEAQRRGHLEGIPHAARVVVFFSSSGDEIAELDLDWAEYLHSQETALAALADACRQRPDTALVVRTHPHMRLKPAADLAEWMAAVSAAGPDVHFDPSSPIDSYELMRAADIVFTYGSTAGVESAFIGKPVVVMGPSAYDLLGCAVRIRSAEEIDDCLDAPPAANPAGAILYGLMMQRRGFNYHRLSRRPDGHPAVAGVPLTEASVNAQKVSDIVRRVWTRWLTRV